MTEPLAVAGGFFWITMNIIETVDNFLTEHKIILNNLDNSNFIRIFV